jgi:hypothetical protein
MTSMQGWRYILHASELENRVNEKVNARLQAAQKPPPSKRFFCRPLNLNRRYIYFYVRQLQNPE